MKPTTTKRNPTNTETHRTKSHKAHFPGGKVLPDHIATAAYYRAQSRGFEPGKEIEDWLNAEAELLNRTAG